MLDMMPPSKTHTNGEREQALLSLRSFVYFVFIWKIVRKRNEKKNTHQRKMIVTTNCKTTESITKYYGPFWMRHTLHRCGLVGTQHLVLHIKRNMIKLTTMAMTTTTIADTAMRATRFEFHKEIERMKKWCKQIHVRIKRWLCSLIMFAVHYFILLKRFMFIVQRQKYCFVGLIVFGAAQFQPCTSIFNWWNDVFFSPNINGPWSDSLTNLIETTSQRIFQTDLNMTTARWNGTHTHIERMVCASLNFDGMCS